MDACGPGRPDRPRADTDRCRARYRYGELALPVVIMAGDGDLIAKKGKHAQRLVKDVKAAELRIIADQGHLFHYAAPASVVKTIDDVIGRAR